MSGSNNGAFSGGLLNLLRVFAAAARQENMVRAGADLQMTQGAVSRHVKALESRLNTILFRRSPRGLVLTETGDLLADYVWRAFDELENGLYRVDAPRFRSSLTVVAPRSFALRVLAPRVASFVKLYPWIDLRLDAHRYYSDLGRSVSAVAIRAGRGNWSDFTVERITEDELFPVCAPDYHGGQCCQVQLQEYFKRVTLLHYLERRHWETWLEDAGLDSSIANQGVRFSESALALVAAESGQGVAIGRTSLVADALSSRRLVCPVDRSIRDGVGYFLITRDSMRQNSMVKAFRDWLLASMSELAEKALACRRRQPQQ
ncbi:MAG: LysR substrate-binding domain-containing protein [Acetobacteraceae bacterium]